MKSEIENFIAASTAAIVLLGAIYLKFYWKAFGINAFDFASLIDIGLSTSGQLMMLIYSIVIVLLGILVDIALRNHPIYKQWITTMILFLTGTLGYIFSIKLAFEAGWVTEFIGALSLLLLTVFFCQIITWFLNTQMNQNKSDENRFRIKALTWIALVILIGMSYLEAIDDSNDILGLKKYNFVLSSDAKNLPLSKMIFLGKIGKNYFFKEHQKEIPQNSSHVLKTYVYEIDDKIFEEGIILYSIKN